MDITSQEILDYMASYNIKIFPMQYVAYFLGLLIVILIFKPSKLSDRMISGIHTFLCLWVTFVFALPFAMQGELIGTTTAIVFGMQGLLFVLQVFKPRVNYGIDSTLFTTIGLIFILYAMVGYPIIGNILGHTYPRSLPFGLAPCPLTVFIFGTFMLTRKSFPVWLLVFPILYSITGVLPILLGLHEDIGLVLSGLVCTPLILWREHLPAK
jgi:hypothetical protein